MTNSWASDLSLLLLDAALVEGFSECFLVISVQLRLCSLSTSVCFAYTNSAVIA
jgi:hypothetical protein